LDNEAASFHQLLAENFLFDTPSTWLLDTRL